MRPILIVLVTSIAAACPQAGPPAMRSTRADSVHFYDVGTRPRALVAGDFTGDRYLDVAVANGGAATITLLTGDGTGTLRTSAVFAGGTEPSDIGAADFDRDGDLDLVVTNHETPLITVLLNNGSGAFTPAPGSPFNTGARPHVHGLVIGDFDSDGRQDVAVESADTKEVRILRGSASGLETPVAVPVGTMPYTSLGAGRVAGTTGQVILVPGHGDSTVRGVESRSGAFRLSDWTIRLTNTPWMAAGGDVNKDGRGDVVAVLTNAVSVWLGGDAGFASAPGSPFAITGATEVAVSDLDGDGADDIAVGPWDGSDVVVLTNGAQTRRSVRMCERPVGLAIADLDGDGRPELISTCTTTDRIAVTTAFPR